MIVKWRPRAETAYSAVLAVGAIVVMVESWHRLASLLHLGLATFAMATGLWVPIWTYASTPDFYVATAGSDSTGDGSLPNPWATLDHARIAMRTLKVTQTRNQTVHFAAGTYQQTATTFTEADSGLNGFTVTYKSDTPGAARLTGGRILDTSTCSLDSGSIYSCPILVGDDFETFYIDGVRAVTARTPNLAYDAHFATQQGPYFLTVDTGSEVHDVLQYAPGDVNMAGITAADVRVVVQSGGQQEWWWDVIPVASVNTGTHQMTLTQFARYYLYNNSIASRYYLKGACAWLDAVGEYCIDRTAHRVRMYGNPVGHELVVPVGKDVIRLAGADASHRVTNVVLDGLQIDSTDAPAWFRYGAWGEDYPAPPFPPGTPSGPDWDPTTGAGHIWTTFAIDQATIAGNQHANVFATNADHIQILNTHILNSGFADVFLFGTAQTFTITHNWFERAGYSALQLEGGYPAEGNVNTGHTVSGNLYARTGEVVGHGRCVHAGTTNSTFSASECSNTPREGVFTTATCTGGATAAICYSSSNTVSNFWIHDSVQDSSDAGGVYTASLMGSGTPPYAVNTYSQVSIDRVFPNPYARYAIATPVNGFYIDVNASGQVLANVEVTNTRLDHISNSGALSLTNVSWVGGFSTAGMDYPNIGLDLSTFPYASASTPTFDSDFSPLTPWTTGQGAAVTVGTSNLCGGGTHSALFGDGQVQYHLLDGVTRRKVILDFYDSGSSTAEFFAHIDEGTYSAGTFSDWNSSTSVWRAMGIDTATSTGFYVTLNAGSTTVTSVARSVGCHQFAWDYESNDRVIEAIDGTTVASPTGVRQFNVLALGDFTADVRSGAVYVGRVRTAY